MKSSQLALAAALGMTISLSPLLTAAQVTAKGAAKHPAVKQSVAKKPLTEDQKILHVLNRLGFGPRPGDVERVKKMGLKNYIDEQLNPEKIKDDAVEAKTAGFDSLKVSGLEIADMERSVQMNNQARNRMLNQMAQQETKTDPGSTQGAAAPTQPGAPNRPNAQVQNALEMYRNATPEQRKILDEGRMAREKVNQSGSQLVMNKIVRAAESEKQLNEVMVDFWSNHFNIDATKVRAAKVVDDQQVIRPHVLGKFRDLLNASSTSAAMMIYLDNAQSVAPRATPQRPGGPQITLEQLKRGAERGLPQAMLQYGRIQERAKAEGITEEEAFKRFQGAQRPGGQAQRQGLNENYARELMELHTLGVDGGYTQKDVTEAARCLTGWGIRGGRYSGEFEFHPFLHDQGEKEVLGKKFPAGGGMEDGKMLLDLLASHPSTMRFISTKLCRRFVSDDPPKSLVDKCVETWKRTDGDIKSILKTIFDSPEFFSETAYKAKIKSPFEYVVSAVRATGASVLPEPPAPVGPGGFRPAGGFRAVGAGINVFAPNGNGQVNPRLLSGQIGTLGEPLFNYGFPTGYPEESTKWVSAGALIGRINFALSLVNGRISDVDMSKAITNDNSLDGKPLTAQVDAVAKSLLGTELTPATRATLLKQLQADDSRAASSIADTRRIASLLLGSPDFQRR